MLVVAEDYLKIIGEIRTLEKGALGDYINQRLNPLQKENKYFVETLYKYILYVLRNVDEPGDQDMADENGVWPVFDADGKMKLTGYQTRLHDIIPSLHSYKANKITEKTFNFGEEMRRFEKDELLNIYTYTLELKEKLDEINRSIIKERLENYVLPKGLKPNNTKPQQAPEPKQLKEKIPAPIIALFCWLISETKIEENNFGSIESFCQKVCHRFNLPYTDRVRQNFNGSDNRQNREKVKKQILPIIDNDTSKILTEYLANKHK